MIKLFDVEGGAVIPTEHVYIHAPLKAIIDKYETEDKYMPVLEYVFYMSCPNPKMNPFLNLTEDEKEDYILSNIEGDVDAEDILTIKAINHCKKLYETPTLRMFKSVKNVIDKIGDHLDEVSISSGKDGNITEIMNTIAKFDQARKTFNNAMKDLDEEQSRVRGDKAIAYDQL